MKLKQWADLVWPWMIRNPNFSNHVTRVKSGFHLGMMGIPFSFPRGVTPTVRSHDRSNEASNGWCNTGTHFRDHLWLGGVIQLTCWSNPCQSRKFHKVHLVEVWIGMVCIIYYIYMHVSTKAIGIWFLLWYSQSMFFCKFCSVLHVRLPKSCWCIKKSRMRIGNSLTKISYSRTNHQKTISKIV